MVRTKHKVPEGINMQISLKASLATGGFFRPASPLHVQDKIWTQARLLFIEHFASY